MYEWPESTRNNNDSISSDYAICTYISRKTVSNIMIPKDKIMYREFVIFVIAVIVLTFVFIIGIGMFHHQYKKVTPQGMKAVPSIPESPSIPEMLPEVESLDFIPEQEAEELPEIPRQHLPIG